MVEQTVWRSFWPVQGSFVPKRNPNPSLSYPIVKDCICISVEHKITGSALKLLVVVKEGELLDKRALAQYLKSKLELYKVPLIYEEVENIERTFNGKIDRKYYKNPTTKLPANI